MMFVTKNPDKYQPNATIRGEKETNFIYKSIRLSSVQKGVCYSSIRIFNKLPPHSVQLCENTMAFKNTLKNIS